MNSKTIYVVGGIDENNNHLASMEIMKFTDSEWKLSSTLLPIPLSGLQVVASKSFNHVIYAIGGYGNGDYQKKIYALERNNNHEWKEIGSLKTKRAYHTTLNVAFSDNCELL